MAGGSQGGSAVGAHVAFEDVFVSDLAGGALVDDAASVEDVDVVGEVEGPVEVLLDEEEGGALLGDVGEELEDAVHDEGGESDGGFVDEDQAGAGDVGADQGQHLLLSAGEAAGGLAHAPG